ncbi:Gaa1-like protein [Endogone sp. FLAS-F59071]|nr:Gaa1-like protein [Endogone sp. FLAS-F59071]|eukprot:RUS22965.1 Gaa1-like protein [Endogone sp. FLAS-F59071]
MDMASFTARLRPRLPLEKRLERRAYIISLLNTWVPRLSVALYFVALAWLLLLPYDQYNKKTYMSENALLPAQINVYYGFNEINDANDYRNKIEQIQYGSNLEKAQFIETELRGAGFHSAIQNFSSPFSRSDTAMFVPITPFHQGVNAVGIYHAPRSDGTESLVLSAPWVSRDSKANINGVAVLLSIARMFKRHTYWSKDIIILVTDDGVAGTQAWLDAYHGEQGSPLSPVMPRAGAIQAGVNLDFSGTGEYESVGIFFEGVNGQLPNLDLVNTVVRVARITSQIPVTLHDERMPTMHGQAGLQESYLTSLKSMLYTMRYQALGHPTGDHGLYLRYKIDAITLYGVPATSGATFGFHRIGAYGLRRSLSYNTSCHCSLVESTFRSLNNLLEHFHQSFFFYFLSGPERYVSIGMYMPPVILFACSLVFDISFTDDLIKCDGYGLVVVAQMALFLIHDHFIPIFHHYALQHYRPTTPEKDTKPQVPLAYSSSRRILAPAFFVMFLAHAAGLLVFFIMRPASLVGGGVDDNVSGNALKRVVVMKQLGFGCFAILTKLVTAVAISLVAIAIVITATRRQPSDPKTSASLWQALKSVCLAHTALGIVAVSPTNFSLAIVTALVVTLPYLAIRPAWWTWAQAAALVALSPPGLLALFAAVSGTNVFEAVRVVLGDYETVGTWVLMYVCCMYWPVNLAMWAVVFCE